MWGNCWTICNVQLYTPSSEALAVQGGYWARGWGKYHNHNITSKSLEVPLCPLLITSFQTFEPAPLVWDSVEIDVCKLEGMHRVIDVWIYIKIQFPIFDQESEPGNDDWRTKLKAVPNIEKINIVPQASLNIWKKAQTKAKPVHDYYLRILLARNIKNILECEEHNQEIRDQRITLLMSKILKHWKILKWRISLIVRSSVTRSELSGLLPLIFAASTASFDGGRSIAGSPSYLLFCTTPISSGSSCSSKL